MDQTYEPPRRLSLLFNLGLGLLAMVAALLLLIIGSGNAARDPNLLLLASAVLLLGVFTYLNYQTFLILSTHYLLDRSSLEIRWGFQRERIPLDLVEWAHPVSDFDSPMPLPGFLLPFQYFGKRNIRGLGLVEFAATDKPNMVLIRTGNRHFVISPQSAQAFAQQFEKLSALGTAEAVEPVSQNLRAMLGEIVREEPSRKLLIAGLASVLLLTVITITFSATRLDVTWITLERVPSSRLFLLLLVGVLDWLLNILLGAYFYLQSLLEKRWVFLVWGWSVLVSLILAIGAVFMSLGSA